MSNSPTTSTYYEQLGSGNAAGAQVNSPIGFFGATPASQPTTAYNTSTGVAGSTNTVYLNTAFTGGTGTHAYTIGDIVAALKTLGLIAS